MKAIFVYVAAPNKAEARDIARAAVEARLAACANIVPGVTSLYRWKGKIAQGREVVLLLKTRKNHFKALSALIRQRHSAQTPCIVALPLHDGDKEFIKWIFAETGGG